MLSILKRYLINWFTPTSRTITDTPPTGTFVKGVNLGGKAVTIEGHPWESYQDALANGLSADGVTPLVTDLPTLPPVEGALHHLLNSAVFKANCLDISQTLDNGTYALYLWIMENHIDYWHRMDVRLNGQQVDRGVGKLKAKHWARYGPYQVTVTQNKLTLTLSTNKDTVDAHLMGFSLFQAL